MRLLTLLLVLLFLLLAVASCFVYFIFLANIRVDGDVVFNLDAIPEWNFYLLSDWNLWFRGDL